MLLVGLRGRDAPAPMHAGNYLACKVLIIIVGLLVINRFVS